MPSKILAIGDIVGQPGRRVVKVFLESLRENHQPDLVIANAENAAGGYGLTPAIADELLGYGIDVLTSGNHIWTHKEIIPYMDGSLPLIRPLNYPPGVAGRGYLVKDNFVVVNLIGRVFLGEFDCPFRAVDELFENMGSKGLMIIVDFHAEATSEKMAMGYYLDGRVGAVLGTHTHVATADNRVLPRGTAYITDLGMSGVRDSVIGDDTQAALDRFLTATPGRLPVARGRAMLNGALITLDEKTGLALGIERVYREEDE